MGSTEEVKQALRALALQTDTATTPYATVIHEADTARSDVKQAAEFTVRVGLDRLATAVTAARRAGDTERYERGCDTLEAYQAFRAVVRGDDPGTTKPETGKHMDR